MSREIPFSCQRRPMWEGAHGISNGKDAGRLPDAADPPRIQAKKDPAVARRVGKFWERMPERQDLYALHTGFVQLRNTPI
ncbi:hypothetical protein [Novosphingobium sp. 17-62-19]|uniref:hypothetical protein n=1 Tax=Novosphingobium sp. 17-62-19 TaxID=1970406 RepID=UPI0025F19C4E|nr:hypothetical protein [Novosphingobium sp. 17-62-19]HQS98225.1 hypothetical protein [Novosphingobium sp.]